MIDRPDTARVIALPPLIYLAALATGLILNWLFPLALRVPLSVRILGGALLLSGFALAGFARAAFGRVGTEVNPMRPATALATSGPFRFSRNPMYVGLALVLGGLALLAGVGWLLILLLPVLAIMHWGVVLREERYLARKFGADYAEFRARVRRYF